MQGVYTLVTLPHNFKWLYDAGHFYVDPEYESEFLSTFPCLNK